MATYKEKLEELRRGAEEKVRELDEKFNIRERIEESAKMATGAAKVGADTLRDGAERLYTEAEKLRTEAEKMAEDSELSEHARKVASEAAQKAREVGETLRETAGAAGAKAGEAFGVSGDRANEFFNDAKGRAGDLFNAARRSAESAAGIFNFGVSWTKIFNNTLSGVTKAAVWTTENPVKAAGAGFSVLLGFRLGSALPFLSTHWLPSSALPVWGLKKASDQFNKYLTKQEELIQKGELTQAEAERVRFERDIVKYVGAPLLGAFSCAAGAAMWSQILSPRTITGAPISWLLGGNPVLDGIWLFGNGVVCFKIGYDFFMVALEDQQEVQRIVREIKGLLPTAQEA
ncbi:MAG TPA: hypothetical protein VEX64_08465 [Pyrinomonadaceae bacterium]|nr:hypothetical protein [Pyrinomonadaceae bacterium]